MKKVTRYAASTVANQRLCADFCKRQKWSQDDLTADIFLRGCELIDMYFEPVEGSYPVKDRLLMDEEVGFWPWFKTQYTIALRQFLAQSNRFDWNHSCNIWVDSDRLHNQLYYFILQSKHL